MADPKPDLKRVLDRLFEKSEKSAGVAGHALFESKTQPAPQEGSAAEQAAGSEKPWLRKKIDSLQTWKRRWFGPVVGIDLGTSALKLVRIERLGGAPKVTGIACEEVPSGLEAESRQKFFEERLGILKNQGLLEGRLVFGVADDRITAEAMTMPKMPAGDLTRAVAFEAKERLNAQAASHCVRHLLIDEVSQEGKSQLELLVFAVPREEVVGTYELLSSQGSRIVAAEPGTLANAEALEATGHLSDKGFVAVLDIGYEHSSLACVVDGRIRFIRSFSVAGQAITQSIVEYCQVDYALAEEKKKSMGLSPGAGAQPPAEGLDLQGELQVRVRHAMALYLERLATEVDHSLRYVTYYSLGRAKAIQLERLYLVGGGALLKNLPSFLGNRLNTQVEVANPFDGCAVSDSIQQILKTRVPAVRLIKALGLAFRPLK